MAGYELIDENEFNEIKTFLTVVVCFLGTVLKI